MKFQLTEEEVRVLGCLIEKEMTTPEYYPLSLNALVNACNQKSNRYPVVDYSEETVGEILDGLRREQLVLQSAASRVPKFEERFTNQCKFVSKEVAVLTVLMLRGPQTVGEIRGRSQRIYDFQTLEEVFEAIEELEDAGYMKKLPRQPGQKEARFAHLLSGMPENPKGEVTNISSSKIPDESEYNERLETLEGKVHEVEEELNELKQAFIDFQKQFE